MSAQLINPDYHIDQDAIVSQCHIDLPLDESADQIHTQYVKTCTKHFKLMMLSSEYLRYPDYFKKPFEHLFTVPDEENPEGIFDLDSAFDILDQMLSEHIHRSGATLQIIGSALQDSYVFFEEILEIAVTSNLFPAKRFIVESNDYGGSSDDQWVTIYECQDGIMKSVYCSG